MISPGIRDLGDFSITSAGTQTGDWVESLEGMLAIAVQARLAWGSGGTSVKLFIQSSLDGGTTAFDVACIAFGAASEVAIVNLSALTPKTTPAAPTDGTLADDTCVDGQIGDRVRAKLVSLGTYAGSTLLSVRAGCR